MTRTATVALGICLATAAFAGGPSIEGTYVEVRSCDVYTAACYANSEVGLTGKEAILTWDIAKGSWNGVDLNGLKVMAVLKANETLGDRSRNEYSAKAVVFVDERATEKQAAALVDFAKDASDGLIKDIVRVEARPISVKVAAGALEHAEHHQHSMDEVVNVKAGATVEVSARSLHAGDQHCGNESVYYPPLTRVDNATAYYTLRDAFLGEGFDLTWNSSGKRSTFLAKFSR